MAAVREAVPGALESYGPGLSRSVLFGSVFAVAVRDAAPPRPLTGDLIDPGSGSPDELQRLARAATLLLDPVQRGCLDLALRHGLEGEALSEALGVAPGLASVSVQAATDQAEHVIGAVLLARVGRDDCVGLADVHSSRSGRRPRSSPPGWSGTAEAARPAATAAGRWSPSRPSWPAFRPSRLRQT